MAKPVQGEYGSFYEGYISKVDTNNLHEAVNTYSHPLSYFYVNLPEEKADYRYAPEKWTLKDLLQHVIDTERIMQYRLLRIGRNDSTPLPGFEENDYAITANASLRSFVSLKEEFIALRKSTDLLIQSLSEEQLNNIGKASGNNITANAVGYIIFGHMMHHKKLIEERYL
ncbi:MAG: DinB family protein [Sphingobacteriia bacterium]|nr:MAG: DinB family protein [Sphingobacteriia bacterium]